MAKHFPDPPPPLAAAPGVHRDELVSFLGKAMKYGLGHAAGGDPRPYMYSTAWGLSVFTEKVRQSSYLSLWGLLAGVRTSNKPVSQNALGEEYRQKYQNVP